MGLRGKRSPQVREIPMGMAGKAGMEERCGNALAGNSGIRVSRLLELEPGAQLTSRRAPWHH